MDCLCVCSHRLIGYHFLLSAFELPDHFFPLFNRLVFLALLPILTLPSSPNSLQHKSIQSVRFFLINALNNERVGFFSILLILKLNNNQHQFRPLFIIQVCATWLCIRFLFLSSFSENGR